MAENLDIFYFRPADEQMARIATLDTGASLFSDHRDPAMVAWLNGRRDQWAQRGRGLIGKRRNDATRGA